MLKIGSLCTGYGGLDMAVEAYFNAETVWTCELDKYASKVVQQRIGKPNHGDLKTTDWANVEPIDILTAGYPCQPFSTAGKRKGAEDDRHLWPYIKEIIRTLRPSYVFLENVRGHFGLGFRDVLGDLTSIGYDAKWALVRASDVGAPHRRERLFILAYPNGSGLERQREQRDEGYEFASSVQQVQRAQYSNSNSERLTLVRDESRKERYKGQPQFIASELVEAIYSQTVPSPLDQDKLNPKFVKYLMGLPEGWVTDCDISRTQQLKILGNGVVPQQAYKALELLVNNL